MYSQHPEMAKRWEAHTPKDKKLPLRVEKKAQISRLLLAAAKAELMKQAADTPPSLADHISRGESIVNQQNDQRNNTNRYRAAVLGGLGLTLLGQGVASHLLDRSLKQLPQSVGRGAVTEKLRAASNLPQDLPIRRQSGLQNAYYEDPHDPMTGDKKHDAAVGKHGLIAYDPHFNRPAILAHEMGHADMRVNHPWYSPTRFNQSWLRPAGDIANMFSGSVGGLTGVLTKNPLYGTLAGLGTGLATSLPTLINEHQASQRAIEYLKAIGTSPERLQKNRRALRAAYSTYLLGGLAPGAGAGLIGGLLGKYAAAQGAGNPSAGWDLSKGPVSGAGIASQVALPGTQQAIALNPAVPGPPLNQQGQLDVNVNAKPQMPMPVPPAPMPKMANIQTAYQQLVAAIQPKQTPPVMTPKIAPAQLQPPSQAAPAGIPRPFRRGGLFSR